MSCIFNHLLCIQSRFIQEEFAKFVIIIIFFSGIFHGHPLLFFSISLAAYFKLLECLIEVNNRVFWNVFGILNITWIITNYKSSLQSKWRWWITPFGIVFNKLYSSVFRTLSRIPRVSSKWNIMYVYKNFMVGYFYLTLKGFLALYGLVDPFKKTTILLPPRITWGLTFEVTAKFKIWNIL